MASLERRFEDKLEAAVMDTAEHELVGKQGNLVFESVEQSHEALRDFKDQYPGVEAVIESFTGVEVERVGNELTVTWGWEHEAATFFEFGTSPHTIRGNPVLSFIWREDVPEWVTQEFEQEDGGYRVFFGSVDVEGIDEIRFARWGLRWLGLQLGDGGRLST